MRGHAHLVGAYMPGESVVHRTPLWLKMVLLAGLGSAIALLPGPVPRTLGLALAAGLHLAAGLPVVQLLRPLRAMWLFLAVLTAYQWWQNGPTAAWPLIAGILACVYGAHVLTATTPTRLLLDGLVHLVSPLKRFGADPERFALTLGLMLRSIPFIIGAFQDVRDAARARGLERSPRAHVLPVIIGTVAYARQTGEALAARGLGEKTDSQQTVNPI